MISGDLPALFLFANVILKTKQNKTNFLYLPKA